jgi:MoxR-like ATPase
MAPTTLGNPKVGYPGTGKPSCDRCPSLLGPTDQNKIMGTNVGGPICGKRLIAIGRPGQETAKPIGQITAAKCPEFGGSPPDYDKDSARSAPVLFKVAMPDPTGTPYQPEAVTNCRQCSNYVSGTSMAQASGWNAGYCRANGALLFEDRLSSYAKDCPTRSRTYSSNRITSSELLLFPEYQDGYGRRKTAELLINRSADPQKLETQAPVSAVEARHGVRAWRLISDPEGYGPDIKLPVFARDFFDANAQAKIPVIGDDERPEDYLDHGGYVYKVSALWMELDETPALWGPAGVGKTELFRHLAFLAGLPFERISITGSSEVDDIIGKPAYSPERGTFFTYGRLPRAWRCPCVICLDEPNAGPPDIWQAVRPLTDNSKQLVIDQNEGERIQRHPSCYLGMAMNPAWDARNSGVATLADADGSRLMHIYMDIPPAEIEVAIIRRVLERDGWENDRIKSTVSFVMKCAGDLRKLSADGTLPVSWGLRPQIQVARAMKFFSPLSAYRAGVADSLEPAAQQAILDIVKSNYEE